MKLVNESNSYSEVAKKLGLNHHFYGNRQTVKKYIEAFDISVKHFGNYRCGIKNNNKISLNEILVENSSYRDTRHIKEKLYKNGLKKRECELCGQDEEWKGKKMSLILDHINGINNDNRLENLRIVCPNCNATLDTHCLGYNRLNKKDSILDENILIVEKIIKHFTKDKHCECGTLISNSSKKCKTCDEILQRKVERPTYEELQTSVKLIGYSATGRKYNVSDNSIRKWIKNYEKK